MYRKGTNGLVKTSKRFHSDGESNILKKRNDVKQYTQFSAAVKK